MSQATSSIKHQAPQKTTSGIINLSLLGFLLRRHRILFLVMAISVALTSAMMAGLWPLFTDDSMLEALDQFAASIPGFDISSMVMTAGEYLDTQWLGVYWWPLAGSVLMAVASKAIAGSVTDGTLETIEAFPLARSTYITTTIVSLLIISLALTLSTIVPIAIMGPHFEIDISMARYVLLVFAGWMVLFAFGLFVLALSAWTRGSALSVGIAAFIMVVMIFLTMATPFVEELESIEFLNLLNWWGSAAIINDGEAKVGLWVYLATVGGLSLLASYIGFLKRDLT